MIEIYLLEALCALYDYGTLSSAAEHLHISQPALSRSMQKLEDLLGVSLFERTKNGVSFGRTSQDIEVETRGKMPTDRLVTCRLSFAEEGMKAEPLDITE